MQLSLRERLGPRARTGAISRVCSGLPASYILQAEPTFVKTVSAAQILARRHVPLRSARDIVERLLSGEEIPVELPLVESFEVFERELDDLGIRAVQQDRAPHPDPATQQRPDHSDLARVVDELATQIPTLDAQRAGAEMYGASQLSVFGLFSPNENTLNRILSDLFDPRGSHGQGPLFLNAFLEALGIPHVGWRDHSVQVKREFVTEAARRIDVVIEADTFLVGIENKPWSGQQPSQLGDYVRELKRRSNGRPSQLVFLSDQEEKSAKGDVRRMPYKAIGGSQSIYNVLSDTKESIKAPRCRVFIEDFLSYIDRQFGEGCMIEEADKVYVEAVEAEFERGPASKKAIAAILLSQERLHMRILDEIGTYLTNEIRPDLDSRTGFRHREWQKCWRLIKPGRKCGAKL
jgi:PD-(D/E)XK nuclease superfamily